MAADSSDKLRKYARKWVGQIGSGGVADADVTTIPLASASNLPTDTAVDVVINRVDANGVKTPSSEETVTGVVSGNNLVDCIRGVEGTAQAHDAGSVAEVLVTAARENDMVDWGLVEHNQDGTHATATVTTLKATGAEINTGTEDAKIVTPKAIADSLIQTGWTLARETWTFSSVNDPTGVITVPSDATTKYSVGMRIKLTNGGNTIYGIITALTSTSITFLHEIDPTDSLALHLMDNSTITNPYYSTQKAPFGFPLDPTKWAVTLNVVNNLTQNSPTKNIWYNIGSLSINFPIGLWRVWYNAQISFHATTVKLGSVMLTLSETNNSESDPYFTTNIAFAHQTSGQTNLYASVAREKVLSLATATRYYINMMTADLSMDSLRLWGTPRATFQAVCAYL